MRHSGAVIFCFARAAKAMQDTVAVPQGDQPQRDGAEWAEQSRRGRGWDDDGEVRFDRGRILVEGCPRQGNVALPAIIAEDSIVPDAHKLGRQDVQTKAPDKFPGGQGHHLLLGVIPVIAIAEADGAIHLVQRDDPPVADRDAMGID